MPRASITLMPLADTFSEIVRLSDGTQYFLFCTFGSKRRFVRRCECEMLCPKPGTAPVTWHTAAIGSFLSSTVRRSPHPRSLVGTPDRDPPDGSGGRDGAQRRPHFSGQPSDATRGWSGSPLAT